MYLIESKEEDLKFGKSGSVKKDEAVDELRSQIALTWIESDYLDEQADEYLEKYSGILTYDDHVKRIERLVWDKEYGQVDRVLRLVDEGHQKYFTNVIKILSYPSSLRKYVNAIPRKFRSSELSRYAKTRWYFKKNETRKATKMLKNIKHMTYPNKWWGLRLVYARELLKTNDGDDSYQIASNHGLVEGDKKYWEAQWTSGWVALRFNDEPEIAYGHFKKLYDYVSGQEDIKKGLVRAIGNPHERFLEDRLRMIRAVRYASRFHFLIDNETLKAILDHADTLFPAVAIERVWNEFSKMAVFSNFDRAIITLHRLNLLPVIFPQLKTVSIEEIEK